jgi:phosphoribosylamine--glycine ligase
VSDDLRSAGILTFGPSKAAAQLESSKAFTKEVCDACGAPTAAWARFTDVDDAKAYIDKKGAPIVVKADGLAAGKGVVVAETVERAHIAVEDILQGAFGAAGAEVVIEDFMAGEEASFFVLSDGQDVLPIGTAQDHKRVGEGDKGPNTGGMGAYSPAPIMDEAVTRKALSEIVMPTIQEMAARGTPYQGVLYVGLMIENGQPRLVEYNVRFGDPECQVLMTRLESDLGEYLYACATSSLGSLPAPKFADETALTVVMAAEGYPAAPKKGGAITAIGPAEASGAKVFHAGTARGEGGALFANGGRVLNVTATGANVTEAQAAAYRAVDLIDFPTGFCRRDIGWREVEREAGT